MDITLFIPIAALAVGIAGWFWVGRRRFQRRNFAGVEEFNGYASMLVARLFERVVRFFSGVALFVGVAGLAMFPGHLLHATTPNAFGAAHSAAATSAPTGARRVMFLSSKCYFYDGHNRLLGVRPAASAPTETSPSVRQRCTLPAETRT